MVLAEDSGGGGGGRSGNRGDVQGEEANSKAVVAAKTGNLAVSVRRSPDDAALGTLTLGIQTSLYGHIMELL